MAAMAAMASPSDVMIAFRIEDKTEQFQDGQLDC
jgi:hypothetical protein